MMDDRHEFDGRPSSNDDLIEIDLNFESMRRFQAEFSPNLSEDGLFIDTGEPLNPGSVVRFRVILPEDFVFLEGTSVVEWIQRAEDAGERPPGMALRFVTLSPQNQELVAQLVQDHLDAGGTPFDIDVRPVPSEFPTDALEGTPEPAEAPVDEAFRLTVRRTEPNLEKEAFQALAEAVPGTGDDVTPEAPETPDAPEPEPAETEEPRGFEVVAGPAEVSGADEVAEAQAVGAEGEDDAEAAEDEVGDAPGETAESAGDREAAAAAEPPKLDWSVWKNDPIEPVGGIEDVVWAGDDREAAAAAEADPSPPPDDDFLPTPVEFDDGPEVIEDVRSGGVPGTAFDVSLPEADDGPDTTPVLPDDGGDTSVTVAPEDDERPNGGHRRLWPLAIGAVVVLVVIGGFLWPSLRSKIGTRTVDRIDDTAAMVADVAGGGVGAPEGAEPAEQESVASGAPTEGAVDEEEAAPEGAVGSEATPDGATGAEAEGVAEVPAATRPEPAEPPPVELSPADAVTGISVEPGAGGTVITIDGNGSLEDGIISVEKLSSPPRVLIRVRGILTGYRPYTIEAATPEVTTVRSGLHEERRPSELWVVVDLKGSEVEVGGIAIRRDTAQLVLSRP